MILLTPEWEECICTTSTPSQRLAEEAQAQRAHPSRGAVLECYKDFADVFSEEAFTHLPPHKVWDHAIELHPDTKLPRARGRTFPLSPAEQKELDECQGVSETGNVSHPSARGTPMDLRNRRSRGRVPAECLEQKMLYAYATVCTQGDFTLSRK